jgi:peroxiredoxin
MSLNRWFKDLIILSGLERGVVMLTVGDLAPEFTARTHEGHEVSLTDYRGRTVVLWFYPKADTPG